MTDETIIKRRRSLTNIGGAIETSGDERFSSKLAHALEVAPDEREDAPDRAHVHGFHTYPARAHAVTARRLVEALTKPGDVVLDPFCGSGTILCEAMLAGRKTIGVDLNPLAVMLARAKTYPHSKEKTEALVAAAKEVAAYADERRKAKTGSRHRLPAEDVAAFDMHVLLELDSLRDGIAKKAPPGERPELSLVLSSILVKVSKKKGDTADSDMPKRIAAGYPAKLFVKRADDLARRFDAFAEALPKPPPKARVVQDDAAALTKVEDKSIDAILTSPPYAATYDYLAHHDLRLRWLGLDERALADKELGARRRYAKLSPTQAAEAWKRELERLFISLARVTKKGAPMVLLIADSAVGGGPRPLALRADEVVAAVAEKTHRFVPVARASQARPHFHAPTQAAFRDKPRLEHLLMLRRT